MSIDQLPAPLVALRRQDTKQQLVINSQTVTKLLYLMEY